MHVYDEETMRVMLQDAGLREISITRIDNGSLFVDAPLAPLNGASTRKRSKARS